MASATSAGTDVHGQESLCYHEAMKAFNEGRISDKEYLHHMLLHFTGVRHGKGKPLENGRLFDYPVALMIYQAALKDTYKVPESVDEIEEVFMACLEGRFDKFMAGFDDLATDLQQCLLKPLTAVAAWKGRVDIIRFLVKYATERDQERTLEDPLRPLVFEHPEILNVLWEEDWLCIQEDMSQMDFIMQATVYERPGQRAAVLQWLLGHGAVVPAFTLRWLLNGAPRIDVIKVLLKVDAKQVLNSGLFEVRCGCGDVERVKLLLDAGVDVNGYVVNKGDEWEHHPFTSLWMAVQRPPTPYSDDQLEVARLLLAHGAKPKLPCSRNSTSTPLSGAEKRAHEDPRMLQLLKVHL